MFSWKNFLKSNFKVINVGTRKFTFSEQFEVERSSRKTIEVVTGLCCRATPCRLDIASLINSENYQLPFLSVTSCLRLPAICHRDWKSFANYIPSSAYSVLQNGLCWSDDCRGHRGSFAFLHCLASSCLSILLTCECRRRFIGAQPSIRNRLGVPRESNHLDCTRRAGSISW